MYKCITSTFYKQCNTDLNDYLFNQIKMSRSSGLDDKIGSCAEMKIQHQRQGRIFFWADMSYLGDIIASNPIEHMIAIGHLSITYRFG